MGGWLDNLQKEAQRSEMHEGNTSPAFFVFLSIAQLIVSQVVSSAISPRFVWAASMGIGSHWLGFAMSIFLGTCKYFDITEDIALLYMIIQSYLSIEGHPSARQQLVYGCALLWCLRLVSFLGYRIIIRGSDFRFDKLIKGKGYNFFAWTSGGTWCWINCFCLWVLADTPGSQSAPLDSLDYAGLCIFIFGLAFETIADIQKYAFNQKYASGTNKRWIESGLWGMSRHPNYFGENTVWLGLAITCIGGASSTTWGEPLKLLLIFISPLWSCFFLVFTSLMLLEKSADKKWGRLESYQQYKLRTPVLFPKFF